MSECVQVFSPSHQLLADVHDKLGWQNFVAGRISKLYLQVVADSLNERRRYATPESWGKRFVRLLMQATHKQWLFRNAHVHYCKLEGLTPQQHEEVFQRVEELMDVDPAELLGQHRSLLEEDFHELGAGSTGIRKTWIASVESAQAAAAHVRSGRRTLGNPSGFEPAVFQA